MRSAFGVICLTLATQAGAQGIIRGLVRDTAGRPLADAEVMINGTERRARTDSSGRYVLANVEPGTHELRARRLGYQAEEGRVRLVRDSAMYMFYLQPRAVRLDTIQVTEACGRWEFKGFVCRRRSSNGKGVFFDVDAIDSANPRFPVEMLRNVPGFRVSAVRNGLGVEALAGWRCVVSLANGKKPSLQNPLPRWPTDVIGVEAYADVDDVPGEYKHFVDPPKRCSLVNYWTTPRPRR